MPTIESNKRQWDGKYDWFDGGDEWSAPWGGPYMQWYGSILPRIKAHLPTDHILEIACGYGRWTRYLKDYCKHLIAIDLSEKCINACKQRFAEFPQIQCHLNDGKSLEMVPDATIGFVFSFDSLVHADSSVVESYLSQLPRILKNNGVAFIHHSNLGEYYTTYSRVRRIPGLESLLAGLGLLDKNLQGRDFHVDARKVETLADKYGLRCVSQEIVLWGTKKTYLDCMSTIVKKGKGEGASTLVLRNADFMKEAKNLLQLSPLYTPNINRRTAIQSIEKTR